MNLKKKKQLTVLLIIGMLFLAFISALHGSLLTKVIVYYQLNLSIRFRIYSKKNYS